MRVDRLLSMILILKSKGKVTARELADHFEVSVRTIYRDMEKISQSGIPIVGDGGKGGGYYILENYDVDNLFLDIREMQTVKSIIESLNVVLGSNKQFNNILMKVNNAISTKENEEKLLMNMSHFSMEEELKEYLSIMSSSIEEDRLIAFDYVNRNMELAKRIVEPIQIEFVSGQWYLSGFCRMRNGYRKFKLVRISNLEQREQFIRVRKPTTDELKKIFQKSYENKLVKIELLFNERMGNQLSEYFYKKNITKNSDKSYTVVDYCPYEEGLFRFILGFGCNCRVIKPEKLKIDIQKYINKILDNYND